MGIENMKELEEKLMKQLKEKNNLSKKLPTQLQGKTVVPGNPTQKVPHSARKAALPPLPSLEENQAAPKSARQEKAFGKEALPPLPSLEENQVKSDEVQAAVKPEKINATNLMSCVKLKQQGALTKPIVNGSKKNPGMNK